MTRNYLLALIDRVDGDPGKVIEASGMSRSSFQEHLKKTKYSHPPLINGVDFLADC